MTERARKKARLIGALADIPLPVAVSGDCMQPLLNDGDRVMIRKSRFYLPGDILVYCNSRGTLVSHRLLGYYYWKGGWWLMIKADNAPQPDGGVSTEQILGKVLEKTPGIMKRVKTFGQFIRFTLQKLQR